MPDHIEDDDDETAILNVSPPAADAHQSSSAPHSNPLPHHLPQPLECRFCRETSTSPLFSPCGCTGSLGGVHEHCLQQWLAARPGASGDPVLDAFTRSCEVCHQPYRVTVGHVDMSHDPLYTSSPRARSQVHQGLSLIAAIVLVIYALWIVVTGTEDAEENDEDDGHNGIGSNSSNSDGGGSNTTAHSRHSAKNNIESASGLELSFLIVLFAVAAYMTYSAAKKVRERWRLAVSREILQGITPEAQAALENAEREAEIAETQRQSSGRAHMGNYGDDNDEEDDDDDEEGNDPEQRNAGRNGATNRRV